MVLKRNFARYAATSDAVYLFADIQEFLTREIPSGISSIPYGAGTLDLQLERRESESLIVVFHAAANPSTLTLPIFVGHKITRQVDASILFVSDPSLDFGIPTGWYAGDAYRPLQRDLVAIISHVAHEVAAQHLVFQGASAGGFASLFYSHHFPGSLAIAINPQTDLNKHHAERVDTYLEACWNGKSGTPEPCLNLLQLYRNSFPNYVLYLQNREDHFHVEKHYVPWAETFAASYGKLWSTLAGNWGEGHAAPPPFFQAALFDYALSFEGNWAEMMCSDDFEPTPSLDS